MHVLVSMKRDFGNDSSPPRQPKQSKTKQMRIIFKTQVQNSSIHIHKQRLQRAGKSTNTTATKPQAHSKPETVLQRN